MVVASARQRQTFRKTVGPLLPGVTMKVRSFVPASILAALLASLVSATAFADEPGAAASPMAPPPPGMVLVPVAPPPADGGRFRGGVALEGGALIVPGVLSVGVVGVQGQLGGQINNNWGVYAVPSFDVVFGAVGGVNLGFAVVVDYTLDDSLTFGVGPDLDLFGAIGGGGGTVAAAGGALYGARLHFGWNPALSHETNRARRKALTIGADLRLLGGGAGFASVTNNGSGTTGSAAGGTFVLLPMLTIGYNAF
jgi:hypothetical protein